MFHSIGMNLSLRLPGSQEGRARKRYYSSSSLSGSLITKEESQIMPHQQKSDLLDTHYSVQAMVSHRLNHNLH